MANNLKFIRRVVRRLKRNLGLPVYFYQPTSNGTDLKTGQVSRTFNAVSVRRCIVLSSQEAREYVYDLSFIAANKDFTYGGFFDTERRLVIVDVADLNGVVPNNDGYIVYNGRKYLIDKPELSEDNRSYHILVKHITTQPAVPYEVLYNTLGDLIYNVSGEQVFAIGA